jgi:hypothetical protein
MNLRSSFRQAVWIDPPAGHTLAMRLVDTAVPPFRAEYHCADRSDDVNLYDIPKGLALVQGALGVTNLESSSTTPRLSATGLTAVEWIALTTKIANNATVTRPRRFWKQLLTHVDPAKYLSAGDCEGQSGSVRPAPEAIRGSCKGAQ